MPKIYNLTDTWNNGATTFDAIKIDVTDTASAAGSKLIDLQVGGASKFKVDKDGNLTASGTIAGLDQVDNVSDADKPVSTAQAAAIGVVQTAVDSHEALTNNPHAVTATQVGLGSVDNTSDLDKPVSTLQQAAIDSKGDFFADGSVPMTGDLDVQANVNTTGAYQKDGTTILDSDSALNNTSVGEGVLSGAALTGINNVGVGYAALANNELGSNNVGIGYAALYDNTSGSDNVGVGNAALLNNTTGDFNLGVGYRSLFNNATGSYNIALGYDSLVNCTSAGNIGLGTSSGSSIVAGSYNLAAGYQTLLNADGHYNIALGWQAARYQSGGTVNLTSADDSIFIGKGTKGVEGATNQIVIGDSAEGLGSNTTVIGSSATTATHLVGDLGVTSTWNDAGTTFSGIKLDVTDTASAAGSNLLDLQVGGVSKLSVDSDGNTSLAGDLDLGGQDSVGIGNLRASADNDTRIQFLAAGFSFYGSSGVSRAVINISGLRVGTGEHIGWTNSNANGSIDLTLYRDAANTLAQRNGVNAQTHRIYNTYTSATAFERAHIGWNDTADTFVIGTEAGSGGGTVRGLSLDATSIGLYGVTPAAQAAHIADATDATDVITRVNAILVALEAIGITAAV